jgi:hypothetical protein
MSVDPARRFLRTAEDPTADQDSLSAAGQAFLDWTRTVGRDEVEAGLRELACGFALPDATRAGFLALICGALVEDGFDAETIAQPLVERLWQLLPACVSFAEACRALVPAELPEGADPDALFEEARGRVGPTSPVEANAWEGLERFWPPAVALLSVSRRRRAEARGLLGYAEAIAETHRGGFWLQQLLWVLDDDPLVVIEPASGLGMAGKMSGIADNFQLHALLMDLFPRTGLFRPRRISPLGARVARGTGPQQINETLTGAWNLHSWRALRPDLRLPHRSQMSGHWIWNEGKPADIPVFEGHRIVLLGPPSYPRVWECQRLFASLKADLELAPLSRSETRDWLQRLAAA